MNKRSSRLIAWLLTLAMILNIAPISAFADEPTVTSNRRQGPATYPTISTLSTGNPPSDNMNFDVRYVIKGDYTYSGQNLLLKTVENVYGQPSGYGGSTPDKCEPDNDSSKAWEEGTNGGRGTLTLYYKPLSCDIPVHYYLIIDKDGTMRASTFQIFQNQEGAADNEEMDYLDYGEGLEAKKFLIEKTGGETDWINWDTYNDKYLNQLEMATLPNWYLTFANSVSSNMGKQFKLDYFGYTFGSEAETNIGSIIQDPEVDWMYGDGQIHLYFRLTPVGSEDTYYTITWKNEDGTTLATTSVRENATPVYTGATPTKASDDTYKYAFSGWTPTLAAVTDNATYTATYDATEKTGSDDQTDNSNGTISIVYAASNAPEGYTAPIDNRKYNAGDTFAVQSAPSIDGYTFSGWTGPWGGTFTGGSNGTVYDNYNNDVLTLSGSYTELKAALKVSSGSNGHAGSTNNENWYEESIGAATGAATYQIKAVPDNGYEFDHWELLDENGNVINSNVSASAIYTPQKADDPDANGLWTSRVYKAYFKNQTTTQHYTATVDGSAGGSSAPSIMTIFFEKSDSNFNDSNLNNGYAGITLGNFEKLKDQGYYCVLSTNASDGIIKELMMEPGESGSFTIQGQNSVVIESVEGEGFESFSYNSDTKTVSYKMASSGNASITIKEADREYVPAGEEYTVRYIVPAKYTYNNQEIVLLDNVKVRITDTNNVQNSVEQKSFTGYEQDNPYRNDDHTNKIITCNYKPVSRQISLRFKEVKADDHTQVINNNIIGQYDLQGLYYGQTFEIDSDISVWAAKKGVTLAEEYTYVGTDNPNGLYYYGEDSNRDYNLFYVRNVTKYSITFVDADGTTVLKEATEYEAGTPASSIEKPADPQKEATKEKTITFDGWTPQIEDVTKNQTYTATYKENAREYAYTIHHYLKGTTIQVADDVTGEAAYGSEITASPVTGKYENRDLTVDEYNPTQKITISENGNEITVYYTLPLVITAEDKTKVYGTDDPALTVTGIPDGVTIDGLEINRVAGENVGEYTITPTGPASQGYYNITYATGTLTVTPATDKVTVTITEHSGTATYDGAEHTVTGYDFASDNAKYTVADVKFNGNATIKGKDAGSYGMELKPEDFSNKNDNFSNVEFVIVDGKLEIGTPAAARTLSPTRSKMAPRTETTTLQRPKAS